MLDSAEAWIERLVLKPLRQEGGYYRETCRSDESLDEGALPARYDGPRALHSSIYYLLTPQAFSALHRLRSDESWFFHAGDPVTMLQLFETGTAREVKLGNSGAPGVEPQVYVPRRVWQGARLDPGGRFALLSCSVAPGFDPSDFELGDREKLAHAYPAYRNRIHVFCIASPRPS
ncbi:MAG: cupin domain-containing protein [Planctomycetaceae bacterium]